MGFSVYYVAKGSIKMRQVTAWDIASYAALDSTQTSKGVPAVCPASPQQQNQLY